MARARILLPLLVVTAAAISCGPEFEPSFRILNERVLAVKAEPPEATPGAQVTLTPLVVSPDGVLAPEDFRADWWRCPDEEGDGLGDAVRCSNPSSREPLGEGAPFTDRVPADIFQLPDPNDPEAEPDPKLIGAVLGYWRTVGLTMSAGERRVDAIKRVVVYPPFALGAFDERLADLDVRLNADGAIEANRNPLLVNVEVRADDPDGPSVASLEPGGTYWLRPAYDDRELQAYWSLKVDLEGLDLENPRTLGELSDEELLDRFERVRRCEVPVFSWYVTAGELRRETTLDERVVADLYEAERAIACPPVEGEARRPEVRFTAPEGDDIPDDGIVRAWVVLRDGRGGTDFRSFELSISE
jgi:hypothetical protein